MNDMPYWKAVNDKYVLKIEHDTDQSNPFENQEETATMVTWHRNYALGNQHDYADGDDFFRSLLSEFGYSDEYYDRLKSKEQLFDVLNKHCVILPVYGYEHGGLSIRTRPFSCNWDSGQLGYIYTTLQDIRKWRGIKRITKSVREDELKIMESMIQTYDTYLQGNVFGYTLYTIDRYSLDQYLKDTGLSIESIHWSTLEREYLTEVDGCWRFYGDDHKNNGMSEHLPEDAKNLLNNLTKEVMNEYSSYMNM